MFDNVVIIYKVAGKSAKTGKQVDLETKNYDHALETFLKLRVGTLIELTPDGEKKLMSQ